MKNFKYFCFLFKNKRKDISYKIIEKPSKAKFKIFFLKNLKSHFIDNLIVITQTRLATYRFKFSYLNRQPLGIKNITGFNLNNVLFKINFLDKSY